MLSPDSPLLRAASHLIGTAQTSVLEEDIILFCLPSISSHGLVLQDELAYREFWVAIACTTSVILQNATMSPTFRSSLYKTLFMTGPSS